MQYTVRNVPAHIDQALRQAAREQHKSLNQVAVEALRRGLGLSPAGPVRVRDLSDIAGSWQEDPVIDEILAEQRRIDPEMWK